MNWLSTPDKTHTGAWTWLDPGALWDRLHQKSTLWQEYQEHLSGPTPVWAHAHGWRVFLYEMREEPLLASCAFHRVKTEALVWAMPSPWHTSPPWLPLSSLQACENVSSFCRTNSLFFCRELSQYIDIPTTTGICWERGGWPPGWGSWSWWIMFCTILGLCHYRGPHSKPLPKNSYPLTMKNPQRKGCLHVLADVGN